MAVPAAPVPDCEAPLTTENWEQRCLRLFSLFPLAEASLSTFFPSSYRGLSKLMVCFVFLCGPCFLNSSYISGCYGTYFGDYFCASPSFGLAVSHPYPPSPSSSSGWGGCGVLPIVWVLVVFGPSSLEHTSGRGPVTAFFLPPPSSGLQDPISVPDIEIRFMEDLAQGARFYF